MKSVRWGLWVLAALIVAVFPGTAQAGNAAADIPFVKGTTWTYAGTVRWTSTTSRRSDPSVVRTDTVRWVSEVVDAFDDGHVSGALLEGGVWDLYGWSPHKQRGTYTLLRVGLRLYEIFNDAKTIFAAAKASHGNVLPANLHDSMSWFGSPLKAGQLYRAKEVGGLDTSYGWYVASATPVKLDLDGKKNATLSAYQLSYRTLASDEAMTIVPGIGITSLAYVHHGTIAEVHVHIVGFRRGGGS